MAEVVYCEMMRELDANSQETLRLFIYAVASIGEMVVRYAQLMGVATETDPTGKQRAILI